MPQITSYPLIGAPLDGDEWVPVVDDPSTAPTTKRVSVTNLWNQSGYYAHIIKAADTLRQSNITLTADPDLTAGVLANTRYIFEFGLYVVTDATADWKHQLTFPAGSTIWDNVNLDGNTVIRNESTVFTNVGMTTTNFVLIKGGLIVGATPGALGIQWAQNTSTVVNTGTKAGSYLKLERATA